MSMEQRIRQALAFGRREEDRLLAAVPVSRRTVPSKPDDWSAKDTIVHFAAWRLVFTQSLEIPAVPLDDYGPDETDQVNQVIYSSAKDLTWLQAEAVLHHAQQRMLDALERLDEAALIDPQRYAWQRGQPLWRRILGSVILHPAIHYSLVYRWLGKRDESLRAQERLLHAMQAVSDSPEWLGVGRYNLACTYAQDGEKGRALALLAEALRLRPDLAEWSKQDPDFASLRDDPDYLALYPV